MSAMLACAPPGVLGLSTFVDWRFLNRAGKVWQALCLLRREHPGRESFPVEDVAATAGVCVKTARRGLADLGSAPDAPAPTDTTVRTDVSRGQDSPVPSYVERESASAPHVERQIHGEGQFCPSHPARLSAVLGRLEGDPLAMAACVSRLCREYGPGYEPFYRKTCRQVVDGRLAVGELIGAVEEAARDGVKDRGRAFTAAVKRRLGGRPAPPAPEPEPDPPAAAEVVAPPAPAAPIAPARADEAKAREDTPPASAPPPLKVEILTPEEAPPSDAEMGFYTAMLGASEDAMFLSAFRAVRICRRDDLLTPAMVERARLLALAIGVAKGRPGRPDDARARSRPAGALP